MRFIFTGTQDGMTVAQLEAAEHVLKLKIGWTTHGNGLCIGADAQFFELVKNLRPDVRIRGFPCTKQDKQRNDLYKLCDAGLHMFGTKFPAPLERNEIMTVWARDHEQFGQCVASPKEFDEQLRSGTWSTIRRARKHKLMIIYLWPDGRVEEVPPK